MEFILPVGTVCCHVEASHAFQDGHSPVPPIQCCLCAHRGPLPNGIKIASSNIASGVRGTGPCLPMGDMGELPRGMPTGKINSINRQDIVFIWFRILRASKPQVVAMATVMMVVVMMVARVRSALPIIVICEDYLIATPGTAHACEFSVPRARFDLGGLAPAHQKH